MSEETTVNSATELNEAMELIQSVQNSHKTFIQYMEDKVESPDARIYDEDEIKNNNPTIDESLLYRLALTSYNHTTDEAFSDMSWGETLAAIAYIDFRLETLK